MRPRAPFHETASPGKGERRQETQLGWCIHPSCTKYVFFLVLFISFSYLLFGRTQCSSFSSMAPMTPSARNKCETDASLPTHDPHDVSAHNKRESDVLWPTHNHPQPP